MRLLIMGAPGAGKGTQASLIKDAFKIAHVSTGAMFRAFIAQNTPLGAIAKEYIDKGNLVPDEITIEIVKKRIQEEDCLNGFLLDGFPRTYEQAVALDGILKELNISLDAVLNIDVEDECLIERITGRRTCPECGSCFHIVANKPVVEGVCDVCGARLVQRADDQEETIKNRINVYYKKTEPVLTYYKNKGLVKNVPGVGGILDIFENVKNVLGEIK